MFEEAANLDAWHHLCLEIASLSYLTSVWRGCQPGCLTPSSFGNSVTFLFNQCLKRLPTRMPETGNRIKPLSPLGTQCILHCNTSIVSPLLKTCSNCCQCSRTPSHQLTLADSSYLDSFHNQLVIRFTLIKTFAGPLLDIVHTPAGIALEDHNVQLYVLYLYSLLFYKYNLCHVQDI